VPHRRAPLGKNSPRWLARSEYLPTIFRDPL
jgi:hypothetical protein